MLSRIHQRNLQGNARQPISHQQIKIFPPEGPGPMPTLSTQCSINSLQGSLQARLPFNPIASKVRACSVPKCSLFGRCHPQLTTFILSSNFSNAKGPSSNSSLAPPSSPYALPSSISPPRRPRSANRPQ